MKQIDEKNNIRPSFIGSLAVIIFVCVALSVQVFVLKESWVTHITLFISIFFAAIVALISGFKWKTIQEGILYGFEAAMLPSLILMLVGILVATWMASGTIPIMIYYGLNILSPSIFLVSVCIICVISSLATGSSWTTGATFGVAFMGIGYGLGIPAPITAGAVISGAVFGDKMSPLSDTTNLASGVAGADLFDHIKSMAYTAGPALLISLVLYTAIGLRFRGGEIDYEHIDALLTGLKNNYNINPIIILPAIVTMVLAVRRVSGLAVMGIASMLGASFAMIFQGVGFGQILRYMNDGFVSETGIQVVDKLLSRGGMQNMMWTISLAIIALCFGGVLEKTKMLEVVLEKISGIVNNVRGVIITHVLIGIGINVFTASQYMAILLPTKMLAPVYKKLRILPQVNSRTAEDAATVTSPLVPWGLCGVYFTGVLGVSTMEYLPYAYVAYLTPLIAILYALTDKFIFREGQIKSVKTYNEYYEIIEKES
ncbi:transporter, NhaC family (TC 2.A.35) [Dethiosulfatibacter aminovorans DSM 17477]|uniref:Transporter, NhaC family (TC 2.A.35) n=1 Tax=Dethiosulfatibacter aminovorans DSM 17477 TaxID=1121476 RepID=A0A1M6MGP4_9FIRM|nr:Na+/H+ antiporter NhaC [Dethiosulfatibacter aminovorans]SHJ82642.1 transporter, NhaC family (TC 2.A.35) [Dethiosulfatibacter aminovorans DSM 17477]